MPSSDLLPRVVNDPVHESLDYFSVSDLLHNFSGANSWLVDHLIPNGGITCLVGKPKAGKSYLTLHLAHSIITGEPLFGEFVVQRQNVCILTKEDGRNLIARRLRDLGYATDLPLYFSDDQSAFCNSDYNLTRVHEFTQRNHASVLIVDSFIRIIGGDENTSKDVTKVHHFFKQLNDVGITIIFTHHQGKEDAYRSGMDRPRGSSDIAAMVDSLLTIKKVDPHRVVISQDALRQDEPVSPFEVEYPIFRFLGYQSNQPFGDTPPTLTNQAQVEILNIVRSSTELLNQATIIERLTNQNSVYHPSTLKNAFQKLEQLGQLIGTRQGRDKFYNLPDQSIRQTSIAPTELSNGGEPCS